jgi:TolB protein
MGARGTHFTPFTGVPADAGTLIPSPDGKTIAYTVVGDGYARLWAMDRDGANRRPIIDGDAAVLSAAWAPDGKKLAVAYSTDIVSSDIAIVNADGTGLVDITPDPLPGVWFDRDPAWSPDGSRIAFSSNRSGTTRIWIMNADGSNAVFLTESLTSGQERQPVWSPDGAFIAFLANGPTGEGIAFIRPDGTDHKHVALGTSPTDPVWLPDGRLVYVGSNAGDFDLHTLDRETGATARLTTRHDDDVHAAVLADVTPFTWLGFAAPVTNEINRPFAVDLAVGDVITDGKPDLLILSPLMSELRIMKGTGNGSFQAIGSLYAELGVVSARTGLVTLDRAMDIVARGDTAFYIWRGRADGPGLATTFSLPTQLRDIAVGDFNGNGRDDIVAMTEAANDPFRLSMYAVNGSDVVTRVGETPTTRTDGRWMCAADVDGDAYKDLVVLAGASNLSAHVALGRGDLTFETMGLAGSSLSTDVLAMPTCADFDGDGRDDIALVSLGQSSGISVHLGQVSGFGQPGRVAVAPSSMAVADVDRDGDLDLIIGSSTTAELFVARNRGDGRFSSPTPVTIPDIPTRVVAADFNGDNWPDVAAIDASGALVVLLSLGRSGM